MNITFLNLQKLSLLLISVFFLACENPTDLGYDFNGSANTKGYFTDTLTLNASTILADSNVNNKASYIMTGITVDPVFGKVKAVSFFQPTLLLDDNSAVYPLSHAKNVVADSIKLRIINTGLIYGDSLTTANYKIHRLTSSMNLNKNYNGDEGLAYGSRAIANFDMNYRNFKTIKSDTIKAFYVNLPLNIAEEILKIDTLKTKTNTAFVPAFPGFAIVPDDNSKGIYAFNTGAYSNTTCSILVYWHNEGETSARSYVFDVNGPRHTQLIFDRKNTALANLTKTTTELSAKQTNNLLYVQGGSGIGTKINFDNFKNLGQNLSVSRAILKFSNDATKNNKLFPKNYFFRAFGIRQQKQANQKCSESIDVYDTSWKRSFGNFQHIVRFYQYHEHRHHKLCTKARQQICYQYFIGATTGYANYYRQWYIGQRYFEKSGVL